MYVASQPMYTVCIDPIRVTTISLSLILWLKSWSSFPSICSYNISYNLIGPFIRRILDISQIKYKHLKPYNVLKLKNENGDVIADGWAPATWQGSVLSAHALTFNSNTEVQLFAGLLITAPSTSHTSLDCLISPVRILDDTNVLRLIPHYST